MGTIATKEIQTMFNLYVIEPGNTKVYIKKNVPAADLDYERAMAHNFRLNHWAVLHTEKAK
jgi:hypothetical protein